MMSDILGRFVLVVGLALLPACSAVESGSTDAPAEGDSRLEQAVERDTMSTADRATESAKPGINARFLSDDLDVDWARRTFESESREIFQCKEEILEKLGLEEGDAVADIGAGTGFFVELFAREVGPDGAVYAVEISPVLVDYLVEKSSSDDALSNVRVVASEATTANLPPSSVDLIFTSDTYHHFEYPEPMLESIHEALRPEGELVIIDFERIEGVSREWTLEHVRAGKEEVRDEVEAAGFSLVEEVDTGCLEENYFLRFRKR